MSTKTTLATRLVCVLGAVAILLPTAVALAATYTWTDTGLTLLDELSNEVGPSMVQVSDDPTSLLPDGTVIKIGDEIMTVTSSDTWTDSTIDTAEALSAEAETFAVSADPTSAIAVGKVIKVNDEQMLVGSRSSGIGTSGEGATDRTSFGNANWSYIPAAVTIPQGATITKFEAYFSTDQTELSVALVEKVGANNFTSVAMLGGINPEVGLNVISNLSQVCNLNPGYIAFRVTGALSVDRDDTGGSGDWALIADPLTLNNTAFSFNADRAWSILVTYTLANTLTVARAQNGTSAAEHESGSDIYLAPTITLTRGQEGTATSDHVSGSSIFSGVVVPPASPGKSLLESTLPLATAASIIIGAVVALGTKNAIAGLTTVASGLILFVIIMVFVGAALR